VVIAKELEWVREYVQAIEHLLPEVKRLKRISARKAHKDYVQRVHAVCWEYYADKKSYKINLYVSKSSVASLRPLKIKLSKYSTMELLMNLAHELAHLRHWYHTPDHKALECSIALIFMTMLKTDGYESEEAEEKLVNGFKIS
jgi:hypothetical protein